MVAGYLFGSHAEGRAHRDSDLDLGFLLKRDIFRTRNERFEDYTQAVRNLAMDERFGADLVLALEPLPGFRNVLVHDYVGLDLDRVVEAMDSLEPVERFYAAIHRIASEE